MTKSQLWVVATTFQTMWYSSEETNNNTANKILEVRCFRRTAEAPHAQRPEAPLMPREGMGFLLGVPWRQMSLLRSLPGYNVPSGVWLINPPQKAAAMNSCHVTLTQAPSVLRMTGATAEILPNRGWDSQRGSITGMVFLGRDGYFPYLPRNRALMC